MKFRVFRFKRVKSTNNTAIRIIKKNYCDFGMILSELQTNGRGQYGRKWISQKGNLFVSFFYNLNNFDISLTKLTKINCMIIKKLLSKYYRKKINFKKPNDLIIQKKKICGILQETFSNFDNKYLIVGIGINLIRSPNIKNNPSTNLYELIKKKIKRKKIEDNLKNIFEKNLIKFYRKKIVIN